MSKSPKTMREAISSSIKNSTKESKSGNFLFAKTIGDCNSLSIIEIQLFAGITERIKQNRIDLNDSNFVERTVDQIVEKYRKDFFCIKKRT